VFAKPPILVRNRLLVNAHLQRQPASLLTPAQRADLRALLQDSTRITQSMVEIAIVRDMPATAMSFVEFRRALVQGLDIGAPVPLPGIELLQVPHVTPELAAKGAAQNLPGLRALRDAGAEARQKLLAPLSDAQRADAETFLRHLPRVQVRADVEVEGESEIEAGDIATITVRLTRQHLREAEAVGPVHAPLFPVDVPEVWWFFVTNSHNGRLLQAEKSKSPEREVTAKIIFRVVTAGKYKFTVNALCDSYTGLDEEFELHFEAKETRERAYHVHKEDLKLDEVPTMFQQMMGMVPDEDEDSEEEAPKKAPPKKAQAKDDDSDTSTESD